MNGINNCGYIAYIMSTYTGLAIFGKNSFSFDKLAPAVSRNNTAASP